MRIKTGGFLRLVSLSKEGVMKEDKLTRGVY